MEQDTVSVIIYWKILISVSQGNTQQGNIRNGHKRNLSVINMNLAQGENRLNM